MSIYKLKISRSMNIDTLVVMGLITRACVLNTVMSAFNNGYRVYLLEDCCGDRSIEVFKLNHEHIYCFS